MVAFTLFWISIYWYGIFYMIAFILGYCFLKRVGKQSRFSNYPHLHAMLNEHLEDLLCFIILGVLIGGRLGHVLIYGNGYYFQHWIEIFQVWKGGMSFIGGMIGVTLSMWGYLLYHKLSRKEIIVLFDLILIITPIGIALWRLGNFLNQELYGIPIQDIPSWLATLLQNLGLTHQYSEIDNEIRVNTNFLSILLEWILLCIIQITIFHSMIKKKEFYIWILATNFLLYYSIIRFFLEYLRADSQEEFIGIFTKSQRFFLLFILIAIILKIRIRKEKTLPLT